jgi:uncharacterized protein
MISRLWDTYNEDRGPRADIGKIARIAVFAALGVIIFSIVSNQSVNLIMNFEEFGVVFTKTLYYLTLSGVMLAAIALVRVNFAARHSITWYSIRMLINFLRRNDYESESKISRYSEFQMHEPSFVLWQLTKVVLFAPVFGNIMFGMAADYAMKGNIDLISIGNMFSIPFSDITMDVSYSRQNVIPMFPALTLLVPPLLAAIGIRLLVYLGVTTTADILSQYAVDSRDGKAKFLSYISKIEIIAGIAFFWIGVNMFFSTSSDYNTKYAIVCAMMLGVAFTSYGFLDKKHARVIIYPTRTHVYSRLFTAAVIIGLTGSIIVVSNSIADTRKIEWNGPYIAQQIEVNRYMHGLDKIETVNYDAQQPSISPLMIQPIMDQNRDILNSIRLWDETNAKTRLGQELAQRSDLGYYDFDILRFGNKIYWTGTTVPIVPSKVAQDDRWFAQHITYTHSDDGMKMLDASTSNVVNESQFFSQRLIYYGESDDEGLFSTYWSAYPLDRTKSDELGGFFYNGTGGVDVAPPMSWMFEPNFMVSSSSTPVHIMRYKDIHDRMELLYPYFVYEFCFDCTPNNPQPKEIEAFIVSDGTDTYWLMPLIVAINTSNIPWSSATSSSFMLQLVGYSLIDSYDGTVQVIVTGNDYFSEMFLDQYAEIGATREVPEWLTKQMRYPEEMFIWQVSKFSTFHVTDPKAYIETKDFYAVADDPDGTVPHYAFAEPPGFETPEFVGIQLLQLKDSQSSNLVGYMVVQNDLENLGKMTFYSIAADSTEKLIGPMTAKITLTGNLEYEEAKKPFEKAGPLPGEKILYNVGGYDVYFVPLFINSGGKQIAIVSAVGATSVNGTYHVGLGDTPEEAFENYLLKISGTATNQPPANNQTTLDRQSKIKNLEKFFTDAGLTVAKPDSISVQLAFKDAQVVYNTDADLVQAGTEIKGFIQEFVQEGERVIEWEEGMAVNFGILREIDGIVESHYISIEVS